MSEAEEKKSRTLIELIQEQFPDVTREVILGAYERNRGDSVDTLIELYESPTSTEGISIPVIERGKHVQFIGPKAWFAVDTSF